MEQSEIRYNDLDKDEKAILKANNVSKNVFNQRIKRGWDPYDAIHLPTAFRTIDGEVRKTLVTRDNVYFLYPNHYYQMQAHGLTNTDVIKRIHKGAAFDEAVNIPAGKSDYDELEEIVMQEAPVKEQTDDNKINYAQLLFEQSCKQFLEAK
ncbi:hypothetical protein [Staphylococcus sp. LKG3-3]|uniref:hypothetical protein n=1 Tax=Staphylococcus sp. LKG3-3 TaxID=3399685 RepID=UPI003D59A4D0